MNESPWQVFIDEMHGTYGRRDPECFWCGEMVYMSLQGFFFGGIWTTDSELEGPSKAAWGPSTECSRSPDGEHDVLRLGT